MNLFFLHYKDVFPLIFLWTIFFFFFIVYDNEHLQLEMELYVKENYVMEKQNENNSFEHECISNILVTFERSKRIDIKKIPIQTRVFPSCTLFRHCGAKKIL